MKKYILYIVLLMLFGFTSAYSQELQRSKTEDNPKAQLPEDPKLSPEENALRLTAGEDNPAKIDVQLPIDPKLDPSLLPTEDDYGDAHAKATEVEPDPRLLEGSRSKKPISGKPDIQTVVGNNQPAGENGGTITNYRNMSGPKDQPRGEEPKSIQNYRDIQGSESQPPGNVPFK